MKECVVVVLGDVGRSPRMQNHAVSLSKLEDTRVHIVGYMESPLFAALTGKENVVLYRIRPFFNLPRMLFPLYAPFKIMWLFVQLLTLFFRLPRFDLILAQNPPSMPTVPFCWLITLFKGKRFVIDWHNLGYSLLRVNKAPGFAVKIAELLEFVFGRKANGHITVTNALQKLLLKHGIESAVVYDRPSDVFKRDRTRREGFARELDIDADDIWLITSTSWTPDEEIEMLLTAAESLNKTMTRQDTKQHLTIIITGKGPRRRWFESEVKSRQFSKVSFNFAFLDKYEDYAALLGCCDIGVSLHVSSSGVDLPMKGLDMIGAGLPVLSVKYPCIDELVNEGENGLLFTDGKDLARVLKRLIITKEISLDHLVEGSIKSSAEKWDSVWMTHARPVLLP